MTPRLSVALVDDLDRRLAPVDAELARRYPGDRSARQPVHTVYVPADRVTPDTATQWGAAARSAMLRHVPSPASLAELCGLAERHADEVYERVAGKLSREPVEDLRVDLEDGYGRRDDMEEDRHLMQAARALAEQAGPGAGVPFCGVWVKSFEHETRRRGIRTLDLFLGAVLAEGPLPRGFVVTLPKVSRVEQVQILVDLCAALEESYGLAADTLQFELQIETPQAVCGDDGAATVARMISASAGRCSGLHYGTYDYSASLGVAPAFQSMDHPVADHAKDVMQVAAASTGVWVSDGSTNVLPVGDAATIHAAWRLHARLVRRSLERGLRQGWDLHAAQLVTRFAATYGFYRTGMDAAGARLRAYVQRADSGILDEPATAFALASYLLRGLDCGAVDPDEVVTAAGVELGVLRSLARRDG
ncbi:MAG: aldolase [Actinomycetota bacterium]|nr:aldolase [Actinomycetota bacterium]